MNCHWFRIVIHVYLYIEGALYAQKRVPSWFLAVFDSKVDVCWNLKEVVNSLIPLGMFMKILNFCVFNKVVSDRKILWFPSKWGVKRWRNGEVVGKKTESWTIPRNCDLALPIDLCTILCVKAHFFTTKEHLTKMRFCFLKFGCY